MVILLSFLFSLFWCCRRGLGSRGMYGDGGLLGVYDSSRFGYEAGVISSRLGCLSWWGSG